MEGFIDLKEFSINLLPVLVLLVAVHLHVTSSDLRRGLQHLHSWWRSWEPVTLTQQQLEQKRRYEKLGLFLRNLLFQDFL